jgi:hypothetical protein
MATLLDIPNFRPIQIFLVPYSMQTPAKPGQGRQAGPCRTLTGKSRGETTGTKEWFFFCRQLFNSDDEDF